MDNYIPSEIEGLIAATSKLKDALVSVQNDLASQVIGKCFKIKGLNISLLNLYDKRRRSNN